MNAPAASIPAATRPRASALRWLPVAVLAAALAGLALTLVPPRAASAFDVAGFGRQLVLADGRIKPLDTVARTALLQIQGRQTVYLGDAAGLPAGGTPTLSPVAWLLDVLYRPERADAFRIFVIDNPDLLTLVGQTDESVAIHYPDTERQILAQLDFLPTRWRRFAYRDLASSLASIQAQAKLADAVDDRLRTPFQRAVVQLRDNLVVYDRLKNTLQPADAADFLGELLRFQDALPSGVAAVRAKEAGQHHDEAAAQVMLRFGQRYTDLAQATAILAIPPGPGADLNDWRTSGQAILESFQTGRVDPGVLAYAGLGYAWRTGQPTQFNTIVELYRKGLARSLAPQLRKSDAEARFNAAEPFYSAMLIFAAAFLAGVASWLFWPDAFRRSALALLALAWTATTVGILIRMWLGGRPPVTNLYSSALFIGWGAVALCLILEALYRNAIGTVAGGAIGFGTLLIAHHLALSGDTVEMMRAVLDSNFWLSTHVIVVTLGYASTFLAGFLALIYIILGVATRALDRPMADALTRMVYGIICFATLFSFVGTVLGGIWADQSWGRFWGWDPKENGALIIVLWNALILHARWAGMVRARGLMGLAVFGNIVTAWSWFGTNMLGIGLHSYGFTSAAFWTLLCFVVSQLAFIGAACVPRSRWRSIP